MSDTDNLADAPEPVESDEAPEALAVEDNADETEAAETETGEDLADDDGEVEDAPPEFSTVEYEGKEYEVPPELKDALLRQADYSQKTMSLAEQRKNFEQQQAHMQQQAQLREQSFKEAAQIQALDNTLSQYDQVNWQALMNEDPVEFQRLDFERRSLQEQRQTANANLQEAQRQASASQQEQLARAAEKTRAELQAEIPDWSPDLEESMAQYAIKQGVNERTLRSTVDKATLKILHDAFQFNQLREKQQVKPKPKPTVEAKPAAKVKGRRQPVNKDPDKMSTSEWMKWRENQISKRAG